MKKRYFILCTVFCLLLLCFSSVITAYAESKTTAFDELIVYVSPDGDDNGDGTLENMLKTPAGAQTFVRESGALGKRPVKVIFKSGIYYLDKGLVFDEKDAGTKENPVTWISEEKGEASFYGSTVLDNALFYDVTDKQILNRIPLEAQAKVKQTNLSEQGINIEAAPPYLWSGSKFTQSYTELMCNNKEQMIARWPNGEHNYAYFNNVMKSGTTGAGKKGVQYGPSIAFKDPRISRWTTAKHAWMQGHAAYTWSREYVAIDSVDPIQGIIQLGESSYYKFSDSSPKEIQVFHLIEELDCPTEWYIDWDTNILYYYPINNLEDNPQLELITLNENMFYFTKDVDYYFTLDGFNLSKCKKRFVQTAGNYITVQNCIMTYGKGAAAVTLGGEHINVTGCVMAFMDGNGAEINCGLKEVSKSVREQNKFSNNYIYDVARLAGSLGHAVQAEGAALDITHNTMHYMAEGTYIGGTEVRDNKVMYNEFYNYGLQLTDLGAFYYGKSGSALGNEVAYNYFYDYESVNPKLGNAVQGVYYDDGNAHGYCHHNIFINGAGYGVQVGGGQYNRVLQNIMVNMRSGPIVTDHRMETWSTGVEMGTKTSTETKNMLNRVGRYARTYQWLNHMGEPEGIQAPYGNVIKDNISDKPFVIDERMAELGKITGNVTVSDHSHFVDPENYDFRIKDDSLFASKIPELTESQFSLDDVGCKPEVTENLDRSFELLYPTENAEFNSDKEIFVWQKAIMADRYKLTIAKDEEMKDIVYEETVPYNTASVTGLEEGQTYFWKVEALNTSFKRKSQWSTTPRMFKNISNPLDDIEDIQYYINSSKYLLENSELENFGENETDNLKNAVLDAVKFYNSAKNLKDIEKSDVLSVIENLKNTKTLFEKSEKINYKALDNKYFKSADEWYLNGMDATVGSDGITFEKGSNGGTTVVTLKEIPELNDVLKFRAKIDFLSDSLDSSWASFDVRRKATDKACWSDKGFMVIVKRHQIEFQKYPGGLVSTIENKWIKDGEWHEFAIGAINKDNVVRFVFAVDGEIVINFMDYNMSITEPGYFAIYHASARTTISESQAEDVSLDSSKVNYYVGGTAYTQTGEWVNSDIIGENNKPVIKAKSDVGNKAEWNVGTISGQKRIYFKKVTASDGDKSAKIVIRSNYILGQEGDEKTKEIPIDFSSGNSEWIMIDTGRFAGGDITVSLVGSGDGNIYANAIRIEEMEN